MKHEERGRWVSKYAMRRRLRRGKWRIWRWGSYRSWDGTLPTIRSVSCKTIILYLFYRCLNRISYQENIASNLFLLHVHHLLWGSCLPLTNPRRSPVLAPPWTNQRWSGGFCKPTCQSRLGKPGKLFMPHSSRCLFIQRLTYRQLRMRVHMDYMCHTLFPWQAGANRDLQEV